MEDHRSHLSSSCSYLAAPGRVGFKEVAARDGAALDKGLVRLFARILLRLLSVLVRIQANAVIEEDLLFSNFA